jgi:diphosphomevalonate decarboxylase
MTDSTKRATARAYSNIAFIKYWGNIDDTLCLPANSSMSMNLDGLYSEATVTWNDTRDDDMLILNGREDTGTARARIAAFLTQLRNQTGIRGRAEVVSSNNFPMGAGIASSASAFAALTVAAVRAADMTLPERELTTLARLGSGSASRSIPTGFVEWHAATRHEDSFAESFAPPDYWNLVDVIAIISDQHKAVVSAKGHPTARTSVLQNARLAGATERQATCKKAVLTRDFATFAEVVEYDSNLMHAVMMTSRPPLFYWMPATLTVMDAVRQWRAAGLKVCYTLDAGPNVHCICLDSDANQVINSLQTMSGIVDIRVAKPGGPAFVVSSGDESS